MTEIIPKTGSPVSIVFVGTYEGYDDEKGHHKIRGSFGSELAPGGHIPWTIEAHWSADLNAIEHITAARFACDTHMCGECGGCKAAHLSNLYEQYQKEIAYLQSRLRRVEDLDDRWRREAGQMLDDPETNQTRVGMVSGLTYARGALLGALSLHGPTCETCMEGGPESREFHRARSGRPNPLVQR